MKEDEGYSKSKIARVLGIHRDTVSKYLSLTEMSIEAAFTNLTPGDGDQVKSQTGYSIYNAENGLWEGTLRSFQPGRGLIYLNNSNTTMSFTYPGR